MHLPHSQLRAGEIRLLVFKFITLVSYHSHHSGSMPKMREISVCKTATSTTRSIEHVPWEWYFQLYNISPGVVVAKLYYGMTYITLLCSILTNCNHKYRSHAQEPGNEGNTNKAY